MSTFRPLPPKPSLEFEHKEAKALLRQLRTQDPESIARARARHPAISTEPQLADAQLVIAREYGFTSWPRLVHYFEDLERQRLNPASINSNGREGMDFRVRALVDAHGARRRTAGHIVAVFLPRCYGMRPDQVFDVALTEDEARLVVARQAGFSSWADLLERTVTRAESRREQEDANNPFRRCARAMEALDLTALQRVVEEHPEVLHPDDYKAAKGGNLMAYAISWERKHGREAFRPVMDWLIAQGLDLQRELNVQLFRPIWRKPEILRHLLDRGADPDWMAPDGATVLEHALARLGGPEAVDLLASRATPRPALWIAAGLGDLDSVRRFLDAEGHPTGDARRIRPPFGPMSPLILSPEPSDEEILMEAFLTGMINGRTAVLEYMVSRGTPVNSMVYGSPLISTAIGNGWVPVVECLVRCGADLDIVGSGPAKTPRQLAREFFEETRQDAPESADRRRIVELCGMDPDAILAERNARPLPVPSVEPYLKETLELAGDDAARLKQSDIRPENLLFGLLRGAGPSRTFFMSVSRMDGERFRAEFGERLRPPEDRLDRAALPLNTDAQAMIQAAIAIAAERRHEMVDGRHLLYALTRAGQGGAADLLARSGGSVATLNGALERDL